MTEEMDLILGHPSKELTCEGKISEKNIFSETGFNIF